jgi:hypothetical protein
MTHLEINQCISVLKGVELSDVKRLKGKETICLSLGKK